MCTWIARKKQAVKNLCLNGYTPPALALALVEVLLGEQGRSVFGTGIDSDIATASIKAVLAAVSIA